MLLCNKHCVSVKSVNFWLSPANLLRIIESIHGLIASLDDGYEALTLAAEEMCGPPTVSPQFGTFIPRLVMLGLLKPLLFGLPHDGLFWPFCVCLYSHDNKNATTNDDATTATKLTNNRNNNKCYNIYIPHAASKLITNHTNTDSNNDNS